MALALFGESLYLAWIDRRGPPTGRSCRGCADPIEKPMLETVSPLGGALAIVAVMAGAAVQAAIGLGLNLFTVPVLALIDPVFVPGPVLLHSFLLSCATSYRLRSDINWRELRLSVGGIVAGTLVGAAALAVVSADVLPRLLGVLVVAAVAVTAVGVHVPLSAKSLLGASTVAGVTGIVAGMHGRPWPCSTCGRARPASAARCYHCSCSPTPSR
jgi:hypothetical protein